MKKEEEREMEHEEIMIFISHTKVDKEFCNRFDSACARAGIKSFRSELETITTPAWSSIREAIRKSCALFLLVGKELVRFQGSKDPELIKKWRYTQNWIAFEIGVACERDEDVWVLCDDVLINFPVPYLNNYFPRGLGEGKTEAFEYIVKILKVYKQRGAFPVPYKTMDEHHNFLPMDYSVVCPRCAAKFNLQVYLEPRTQIICPQCLQAIRVPLYFTFNIPLK